MPSVSIFIPKRLYEKIYDEAKMRKTTISRVIRRILESYYGKKEV